jgi:hypothetical protein
MGVVTFLFGTSCLDRVHYSLVVSFKERFEDAELALMGLTAPLPECEYDCLTDEFGGVGGIKS